VRPDGQFEVLADIKRMVRFVPLNLAEDAYPSLSNDTHAMDVVFCRNVLMYFEQAQARRVVEKVHRAQREGGWLFVGSTELFHLSASPYATVSAPGVVVYRKNPVSSIQPSQPADPRKSPAPEVPQETPSELIEADPVNVEMPADPREDAAALYAQGRYKEAADILGAWLSNLPPERANAAALSLLARCLANQGELVAALRCCDQSIAADKCSAASQYLRALILQEQGVVDEAIRSLRNALYLDPDFVLAHMTLGTLARDRGQTHIAQKHLKQALKMVQGLQPGTILPESEGMTAGQLTNMIHSLIHEEVVP
jgi:chemotaxis protein methyltransferase CheR